MTPDEAFFMVHSDLPREGPGTDEDILWAASVAGVTPEARILDAGCGPGADIPCLLRLAPEGSVVAIDAHAPFVNAARARFGGDARVSLETGDMRDAVGPFDFIWSAGALYFLGVETGLAVLGSKLAPGGCLAFSHLAYTVGHPVPEVRDALEAELPDIGDTAALVARIEASGFRMLGQRILPDTSWQAYYGPMRARITNLRPDADPVLAEVLEAHETEAALHDRFGDQFGYVLCVVVPA